MAIKLNITKGECADAVYTLYDAYLLTEKEKEELLTNINDSKVLRLNKVSNK